MANSQRFTSIFVDSLNIKKRIDNGYAVNTKGRQMRNEWGKYMSAFLSKLFV
jgi:hypothetical protein